MKKYTNFALNAFITLISLLTLVNLVYFTFVQDNITFVEHSVTHPYFTIVGIVAFLLWVTITLVFGIILLFNSRWREQAFLKIAQVKVQDELELTALNEAIKKTFIGNLVLITLLIGVSTIHISTVKSTKADSWFGKNIMYAVTMPLENKTYDDWSKLKAVKETALKSTKDSDFKLDFEFSDKAKEERRKTQPLLSERTFSVYGAMWFLVIQFLMFRVILYRKKREFQ